MNEGAIIDRLNETISELEGARLLADNNGYSSIAYQMKEVLRDLFVIKDRIPLSGNEDG